MTALSSVSTFVSPPIYTHISWLEPEKEKEQKEERMERAFATKNFYHFSSL